MGGGIYEWNGGTVEQRWGKNRRGALQLPVSVSQHPTVPLLSSVRSFRHRTPVLRRHLLRRHTELARHPLTDLVEDLVAGGDDEQGKESRRDHAADHRDTEWRAELRTVAAAERDRQHAGNQREGGHENRTKSNCAGLDECLAQ